MFKIPVLQDFHTQGVLQRFLDIDFHTFCHIETFLDQRYGSDRYFDDSQSSSRVTVLYPGKQTAVT